MEDHMIPRTPRLRPTVATVLLAVVGSLLVPAGAEAASTWIPAQTLTAPAAPSFDPRVVVDHAGNATAVWAQYDGAFYRVQASTRAAGADWTTPVALSAAGQHAGGAQVG